MATLQKMAIALVLLSPYAAQAQSSSDLRKDQNVCSTIAQTVLAIDPSGGWRSPWQQPLRALAKAPGGIVGIDAEGWRAETKAQALDSAAPEVSGCVQSDGGDRQTDGR
jgi:hypothetical protein